MTTSPSTGFNLNDPGIIRVLDELPFWSAPFGIKLLEKIIPGKNMKVLDIGFGTGFPLTELAMRLGDTCRIYGLDPWKAAADRAREKIRVFGIKNVEILQPPVETQNIASLQNHIIPQLPDQSIDLVVSNNGLNNVDDLDNALSECARVLKPGGQLIFTMNLNGTMMEFYEVMRKVLSSHRLISAVESMEKHIYRKRKPLDEVADLLLKNGFSVHSNDQDRFSYTFTDGTTMFNHFFIRIAFLDSWKKVVPMDKQEVIFNEIEDKINEIAAKEGFFRLSIPFVVIDAVSGSRQPDECHRGK